MAQVWLRSPTGTDYNASSLFDFARLKALGPAGASIIVAGSLILLQPYVRHYVHYISLPPSQTPLIGGALLCLGIAAIWISRSRD